MYTRKKIEKNLKKTKKSVDKKGSPWYYIQALERDGKKPKAKSLKGKPLESEHRTLKIKQRRESKEPDKILKEFYQYCVSRDTNTVILNVRV